MRCCTLLVAVTLFLVGCGKKKKTPDPQSQANTVVVSDALVFDEENGLVYQVGSSEPFSGKAVWFHPGGQLQQETSYQDGKEHGTEIWWHEDGSRAGQSQYVDGVLDGPTLQWYAGGDQMEFQSLFKNGEQQGKEIWWHENGREKSTTTYRGGNREGKAQGWYDDGTRAWEANWKEDEPHGKYVEWYESGQLKSEKNYEDGEQDGLEAWWYEHGEKSWEAIWKAGRMEGALTEWYENGEKMSETLYEAGLREGVATGWYEDGTKAYETTYKEDEEVDFKEWLENGEAVAALPEPVGRVRTWAPDELVKTYKDKPEDTVYKVFGEPDRAENGAWVFEGIKIDGGDQSLLREVRFTFQSGKVLTVEVAEPAAEEKEESP